MGLKMILPKDIITIIAKFLTIFERKGFEREFKEILSKHLLQPRNRKGYAINMISYYLIQRRVGKLKRFGSNSKSYFYRHSKHDFQFILNTFKNENNIYGELLMYPQWKSTPKLESIMQSPELTNDFPKFSNTTIFKHSSKIEVTFTWMYPLLCGYILPTDHLILDSKTKIKEDAIVMIHFINERVKILKKSI